MSSTNRLAKALDLKRECWLQSDILDGLGRDPSFERDVACDAYDDAARKWKAIIREEWALRQMERYVPNVAKNGVSHKQIEELA